MAGSLAPRELRLPVRQPLRGVGGRCSRLQPCPVSLEGLSSVARRRRSANGSATQAADDGACEGIAGRSTNQRTTTGADSTAGQRALPWGVSAGGGRQRQCGADRKICNSRHEQLLASCVKDITPLVMRRAPGDLGEDCREVARRAGVEVGGIRACRSIILAEPRAAGFAGIAAFRSLLLQ